MIERLTQVILNSITNAPTPEAGARLAAYRVTDELREAMMAERSIAGAVAGVGYIILTDQHRDDMRTGIAAAWDALLEDDEVDV